MTESDAKTVLEILTTADSGCSVCASGLMEKFCLKWPQYIKLAEEIYKERFDEKLEMDLNEDG